MFIFRPEFYILCFKNLWMLYTVHWIWNERMTIKLKCRLQHRTAICTWAETQGHATTSWSYWVGNGLTHRETIPGQISLAALETPGNCSLNLPLHSVPRISNKTLPHENNHNPTKQLSVTLHLNEVYISIHDTHIHTTWHLTCITSCKCFLHLVINGRKRHKSQGVYILKEKQWFSNFWGQVSTFKCFEIFWCLI